jgi:hypothetical protein
MDLSPAIVEPVDAVFTDMDIPQHPGAAFLIIDHAESVYSKGLSPRGFGDPADDHCGQLVWSGAAFQALHRDGDHVAG